MVNWFLTRMPRPFRGVRTAFSTNGVGKTGYPYANIMKLDPYLIPYTKIKMDRRSKLKSYNYKNLRKKHRGKSLWPWIWQWFLNHDTKTQATNEKIDKLDFIKIKKFCASKGTIKSIKRQPIEWNIYKSYIW